MGPMRDQTPNLRVPSRGRCPRPRGTTLRGTPPPRHPPGGAEETATAPSPKAVQIQMPEMGESVTEGIVLEWHVAEGDFVNEGDTVVEVSTDKVDAEVPAPEAGVITKLLVQVDDEVAVGTPLAEMEPGDMPGEGSGAKPAPPAERAAEA